VIAAISVLLIPGSRQRQSAPERTRERPLAASQSA